MAARIEAATPAGRDRSVDALRALAIAGVILGHWLVTALVLTRSPAGARLHDASPLAALPALAPASWIFQTLAIFFFVGGYAAARSGQRQPGAAVPPGLAGQAPVPAGPPGGGAGSPSGCRSPRRWSSPASVPGRSAPW